MSENQVELSQLKQSNCGFDEYTWSNSIAFGGI